MSCSPLGSAAFQADSTHALAIVKQVAAEHHIKPSTWHTPFWDVCCTQVIDPVTDYLKLLRTIFDFSALKALFARPDFKFVFDGLHGVAGPYAKRIFVEVRVLSCSGIFVCLLHSHNCMSSTTSCV